MPRDQGENSGRLGFEALEPLVRSGEIDTVVTAFPDLYGRLVGKRITGRFFLDEIARHGMHACDYLLACDMEMDPVPGYGFTSWDTGYGDFLCKVDWSTLRRASWLAASAIVLCDVFDEHTGEPVAVAPRSILKRQLERAPLSGREEVRTRRGQDENSASQPVPARTLSSAERSSGASAA